MTDRLYRFSPDGRYQGFVVVDRPLEEYASRMGVDLTDMEPPEHPPEHWPFLVGGEWVIQPDPPRPAPPTPTPTPAPTPEPGSP